ncbi:RecF/RecN/SMC N terminal domain-containing protein [Trifolium repens]|nr:RecF/RecN/SMC N terminal domain-containing protein [Trifolium repens]
MESLYKKLYSKYTTLKTNKLSELEDLNKEQELKFLNFVSAAEELIDHLRSENDKLHGKINDLGNELNSVRLAKDKQLVDHQRLLMEESKKSIGLQESGHHNWLVHALFEYTLDMKLSTDNQTG